MSSRKYSPEFKIKVMEHFFREGGDQKFGNRARTAEHFSIDRKTVTRMLCNPEIVKKARRILARKNSVESKLEDNVPNPIHQKENSDAGSGITEVSSEDCFKGRSTYQLRRPKEKRKTQEEVPVIELPEDPDFSILKGTIHSSVSAAANVAKLLITGTTEVKKTISNECELIFECKVCRGLFRSIINFLAHKRVYCKEEYADVRSFFHKDTGIGLTTESSSHVIDMDRPSASTASDDSQRPIDRIASRLANKRARLEQDQDQDQQQASSATDKGSAQYYADLDRVLSSRSSMSGASSCSVFLQDIAGVPSARYQTLSSGSTSSELPLPCTTKQAVQQITAIEADRTIVLTKDGSSLSISKVQLTNLAKEASPPKSRVPLKEAAFTKSSPIFSSSSLEKRVSRSAPSKTTNEKTERIERTIYTCPICNTRFFSVGGCLKHLIKVHKKKKHQRERLREVIRKRAYRKSNYSEDDLKKHNVDEDGGDENAALEEAKVDGSTKGVDVESVEGCKAMSTQLSQKCPRCGKSVSASLLSSHLCVCLANSATTEKKIAIQIRKDYQKEPSSPAPAPSAAESLATESSSMVLLEMNTSELLQARIKEICDLSNLYCKPCRRKYRSITILKRHAALHLGWTRFACAKCKFRSYERYQCAQHCVSSHRVKGERTLQINLVLEREELDTFRWDLNVETALANGTEEPEEESDDESASVRSDTDMNSADQAYRSLIEDVDFSAETAGHNAMKKADASAVETKLTVATILEGRLERPQRTRKAVERHDFVYEPLLSSSRSDDESRMPASKSRSLDERSFPVKRQASCPLEATGVPTVGVCNGRKSPVEAQPKKAKVNVEPSKLSCPLSPKKEDFSKEDVKNLSDEASTANMPQNQPVVTEAKVNSTTVCKTEPEDNREKGGNVLVDVRTIKKEKESVS